MSLDNLGRCLPQLDRVDEARTIAQEAIAIQRTNNAVPTADQAHLLPAAAQDAISFLELATGRVPGPTNGHWRLIDLHAQPGETGHDNGQQRRDNPSGRRRTRRERHRNKPQ